jgi:hypothetical protein
MRKLKNEGELGNVGWWIVKACDKRLGRIDTFK